MPDRRIGYYARGEPGQLIDLLARRHRFAGAIIGGVIGLLLGAGLGWLLDQRGLQGFTNVDLLGATATLGIIGALAGGTVGGMAGLWTERPGAVARGDALATVHARTKDDAARGVADVTAAYGLGAAGAAETPSLVRAVIE